MREYPQVRSLLSVSFVTRHCDDCARFSCNDRALLAWCLRCIQTVFEQNLIKDNYIIVKLTAVKNGYLLTCITRLYCRLKCLTHVSVSVVTRPLARLGVCKYMKERTVVRSHLSASIVTRRLTGQEI